MGQKITTTGTAELSRSEPLDVKASVLQLAVLKLMDEAQALGGGEQDVVELRIERGDEMHSWSGTGPILDQYEIELVTQRQ